MPLTAPPDAPTAPGDVPQRADPSTFSTRADAFLLWMAGFRGWLASFTTWLTTFVTEANALQSDVSAKQGTASTAANAATAAAAAVSFIYPGTYASPPTLRPDGSPIQAGDLYTDTSGNSHRRVSSSWMLTTNPIPGTLATLAGAQTFTGTKTFGTTVFPTGTYAPAVNGSTTAGSTTYTTQFGSWTRIGDRIFFSLRVGFTGHTGTGSMKVLLPFAPAAGSETAALSVAVRALSYTTGSTPMAFTEPGEIWVTLRESSPGSHQDLAMETGASIYLAGHYCV